MNAGLRAWVASHTETKWAIAIAVLCAALVGATLFWPQSPTQQTMDAETSPVRMSVQSPPPAPKPEMKVAEPAKPAATTSTQPGEAAAPLPSKLQTVETVKKSTTSKPAAAPATPTRGYFVQVGAFRSPERADALKKRLGTHHWPALIQLKNGNMHAVWVGGYTSKGEAEKAKAKLAAQEKLSGFITSR